MHESSGRVNKMDCPNVRNKEIFTRAKVISENASNILNIHAWLIIFPETRIQKKLLQIKKIRIVEFIHENTAGDFQNAYEILETRPNKRSIGRKFEEICEIIHF